MLTVEQLWEARQSVYEPGSRLDFTHAGEPELDELRAVEAAVRADQAQEYSTAIKATNAYASDLTEQLAAAQAVIAEVRRVVDENQIPSETDDWVCVDDLRAALAQSPTDAQQEGKR